MSGSAFNGKKSPTSIVSAGRAALEGMERLEWSHDPVYDIKKKRIINIDLKTLKQTLIP